jgi:hypothetical protein
MISRLRLDPLRFTYWIAKDTKINAADLLIQALVKILSER